MSTLNRLVLILLQVGLFRVERLKKKAIYLWVSAFFLTCIFVPVIQADFDAKAACYMKGRSEAVAWDYVVDGDTLWLKGGRKIRLASINAPEVAHDGQDAEPFGDKATEALRVLLRSSPKLMLQKAERGEDRHGRVLANVFLSSGLSVEASLLRQGLSYQLFPNDRNPYNDCFSEQEKHARKADIGVWSTHPLEQPLSTGFHLVRGLVKSVRAPHNSDYFWVDLDNSLVLRALKTGTEERWLRNMIGRKVEVRGWVIKSNDNGRSSKKYNSWIMGIYQSSAIRRIQ